MKRKTKDSLKDVQGITLIALVITIIVLLILAAVSIATLTGENGILTKAQIAKKETDEATAIEKVKVAVLGSFDEKGNLDLNQLKENLEKVQEGLTGAITELPVTVNVDGYEIMITKNGEVKSVGEIEPSTVISMEEAKTKDKFDTNTEIEDKYGNKLMIPEGFKIAYDSADVVTGGVVIEDVSHGATVGSQFVWIPVGTIYTNTQKTEAKTITLGRYDFVAGEFHTTENTVEESAKDTQLNRNTIAKDIEAFKTSVKNNRGYYIGRYEARTETERTEETEDTELGQVTVKGDKYIYNYVNQKQAAKLSREMYGTDKMFISDLMNSYAWDTAIMFIQEFSGDYDYAKQTPLNSSLATKGTNNLESSQQDEVCNIWDMASNTDEYTTETSESNQYCSIMRGGRTSELDRCLAQIWLCSKTFKCDARKGF